MWFPLLPAAGLVLLIAAAPVGADETPTTGPLTAPPLRIGLEQLAPGPALISHVAPGPDRAALTDLPVLDAGVRDEAATLLRSLAARGRAAGLVGVLYDNRDAGHSLLDVSRFPQLTPVEYAEDAIAERLHYSLAGPILFRSPVIGNASVAMTSGLLQRSMGRLAMTSPGGPERAAIAYLSNHLYVYPEHRDHDDVDLYPANWPYTLFSQGSSYSDRPFLEALVYALAAFRPETRARLEAERLIAPTLQMVLRRSLTTVRSREAYLSGVAHPTVFRRGDLAAQRMVALANAITPADIPPLVVLRVEAESFRPVAGLAEMSEGLFDTPAAIARIWRGWESRKEMIVSAAATRDPNGRPLTFTWVLLRGDPEKVRITPLDPAGTRARITLDWHDRYPISPHGPRLTERVDIAIIAHNGVHDSAPSFVSVSFPTHELRRYEAGPDGMLRLHEIDYDAVAREARFDPVLHWSAPWRDVFDHDGDGRITGWTRHHADGGTSTHVLPEGATGYRIVQSGNRVPRLAPPEAAEASEGGEDGPPVLDGSDGLPDPAEADTP
ncbi:hypothetical protein [Pararhodobacter sp. SW119]|uniref:hypothetical protein n=1 Tax=Pararhodobacter sp. SW119 TaxID=2780075 RepID=UPI001AE0402F|nr:hypothetical protein [Pararhodobacter sp. SW119]